MEIGPLSLWERAGVRGGNVQPGKNPKSAKSNPPTTISLEKSELSFCP